MKNINKNFFHFSILDGERLGWWREWNNRGTEAVRLRGDCKWERIFDEVRRQYFVLSTVFAVALWTWDSWSFELIQRNNESALVHKCTLQQKNLNVSSWKVNCFMYYKGSTLLFMHLNWKSIPIWRKTWSTKALFITVSVSYMIWILIKIVCKSKAFWKWMKKVWKELLKLFTIIFARCSAAYH